MKENGTIKVTLLIIFLILAVVTITIVGGIFIIKNNESKKETKKKEEISQSITKEENKNEEKSSTNDKKEKKIANEKEIINLVKSENDTNLNGYNIIKFGVCTYDQSTVSEETKDTAICSIYVKSNEQIAGYYLTEDGKKEEIPLYQDKDNKNITTASYIKEDDIISELYIGGKWLFRVYSNIFNQTDSQYVGMDMKEMNKMNFIDAKHLTYDKKIEKVVKKQYEIVDVSKDTMIVRERDTTNDNVEIHLYKDLGNGCHIELQNNQLYDSTLKAYSKYKDCSKDELLALGNKISESISILKKDKVQLSAKWQKRLSE